jgi:CRP-like cAMP-binding protein
LLPQRYSISPLTDNTEKGIGMIDSTQLSVLNKLSFFKDYDDERLTDVLPYLDKELFRKDEFIIRTGSQGNKVYFLVSGKVRVRKMLLMNLDYLGYKPMEIIEELGTFDRLIGQL